MVLRGAAQRVQRRVSSCSGSAARAPVPSGSQVFLLAPITGMGTLVSVIALVVAIIAGVTSSHLNDDEDQSGGYWPKGPDSSGSG